MSVRALLLAAGIAIGSGLAAQAAGPPTTLDDVVIFAQNSLNLFINDRQFTGQIVVNAPGGTARLNKSVVMLSGTQIVADTIVVPGVSGIGPELYDVFANTTDPQVVVDGSGPTAVTLPLFPFPSAAVVTPGTDPCPLPGRPGRQPGDCVVRAKAGPVTLPPGNYNAIKVKTHGAIYFTGGVYHMRELDGGGNARIYFNGPTDLYIAERFHLGNRGILGPPSESTLNPRCVVVRVAGDAPVKIGAISNVTAIIEAPDAVMKLGSRGEYRGQFVASDVIAGVNVALEAAPALATPCE